MKFETKFNIIREMYLKKENRNLTNELLKYINRNEIRKFMNSICNIHDTRSFCTFCLRICLTKVPECSLVAPNFFCDKCDKDHFDKYSKLDFVHTNSRNDIVELLFTHQCVIIGNKEKKISKYINIYDLLSKCFNSEDIYHKIKSKPSICFLE